MNDIIGATELNETIAIDKFELEMTKEFLVKMSNDFKMQIEKQLKMLALSWESLLDFEPQEVERAEKLKSNLSKSFNISTVNAKNLSQVTYLLKWLSRELEVTK